MGNIAIQFTWRHIHAADTTEREHKHDAIEIVYYVRGEGTVTVGDEEYPYEPGMVCYIPQNVPHSEYHKTETEVLFFAFNTSENLIGEIHTCMTLDRKGRLLRRCEKIEQENQKKPPHYRTMIGAIIEEILILMIRTESGWASKKDLLPKVIEDTCVYIQLNSHLNLSAMDIARRNGYSYDYFRHNFKKHRGVGLKEFIMAERANRVIEYLIHTDKTIKNIAEICNFSDIQTLSKWFKQATGMSPMNYRKKYRPSKNALRATYADPLNNG